MEKEKIVRRSLAGDRLKGHLDSVKIEKYYFGFDTIDFDIGKTFEKAIKIEIRKAYWKTN